MRMLFLLQKIKGGYQMTYEEFLQKLSNPARNALLYEKIDSFDKLASLTEKQVLAIHGVGPKSLPTMKDALNQNNRTFNQ